MCTNNTGGAHCQSCADGFYGDPNNEDSQCQSCPCPETHRNFAKGCTFQNGRVSCSCRPGYVGDLCEYCASGYYGLPDQEGGGCIDCQCNPHGSVSIECDGLSGECMCNDGIIGKQCDQCAQPASILAAGGCQGIKYTYKAFINGYEFPLDLLFSQQSNDFFFFYSFLAAQCVITVR